MKQDIAKYVTLFLCFIVIVHRPCEDYTDSVVALKGCRRRWWCRREEFDTQFQPVSSVCAGCAFVMGYKRDPNITLIFIIVGNHQICVCLLTSLSATGGHI